MEIEELAAKAINANLKLIECPIRHLACRKATKSVPAFTGAPAGPGIEMKFNTMVKDILIEAIPKGIVTTDETFCALRS